MIFGIFFDFEQDNVIISFFSCSISFLSVLRNTMKSDRNRSKSRCQNLLAMIRETTNSRIFLFYFIDDLVYFQPGHRFYFFYFYVFYSFGCDIGFDNEVVDFFCVSLVAHYENSFFSLFHGNDILFKKRMEQYFFLFPKIKISQYSCENE